MDHLQVVVTALRTEASTIVSYELSALDGRGLPAFTAGAHIDVTMEEQLIRSYSLLNNPAETHRYVIAVNLDAASRGGSLHMHTRVGLGTTLKISEPRNNFPLDEGVENTFLIAGGIGITPMLSMAHRLETLGKTYSLYYCGRQRSQMAFTNWPKDSGNVNSPMRVHVDEEEGGNLLDLRKLIAEAPAGAHFYCCGPSGMLNAFIEATAAIPAERVHLERFSASQPVALEGGFAVRLAKMGKTFQVQAGQSILQRLIEAKAPVDYACMEGVCGSCEVRVLDGLPDHRDFVLTNEERLANDRMMICCSGAKSPLLVLDI